MVEGSACEAAKRSDKHLNFQSWGPLTNDGSIDLFSLLDELFEGERGLMSPPFVVTELQPGMVSGVSLFGRMGKCCVANKPSNFNEGRQSLRNSLGISSCLSSVTSLPRNCSFSSAVNVDEYSLS